LHSSARTSIGATAGARVAGAGAGATAEAGAAGAAEEEEEEDILGLFLGERRRVL